MNDTIKFPNGGYDVVICRRQDIIDCIEKNITDKEVALAIIDNCEFQAANFIREGRWAGIPFIGNIRVPKTTQIINSNETQALIQEAKENLGKEQYIMFRRQLNKDISNRVSQERYYRYITSMAITKNRQLFRKLCKEKGEIYARLFLYLSHEVVAVNNEYIKLDEDE